MVSIEYRKSISEVLEILNHTRKEDVDKISPKFLDFLNNNALIEYEPHLDHSKRVKEMGLNDKTIAILSIIASKYWISTEDKENFEKQLNENERKYQEELHEKYNLDNIFSKKQENIVEPENSHTQLIEYKESFFRKFLNKIKSFFKI